MEVTLLVLQPVGNISYCTSLHHFYFADILLGVGVPDCRAVLNDWPYHRKIGS